jgi:hypothetical protein
MDKSSPGAHATTSICESVLSHDSELSPSDLGEAIVGTDTTSSSDASICFGEVTTSGLPTKYPALGNALSS